jgi:hypothetical protein
MKSIYLQIFLLVDILIVGMLIPNVYRHGRAHFKQEKDDPEQPKLSAAVKERLLHNSEAQFQKALDHSVDILERDLEASASQINALVTRFAGVIVGDEMERYRAELAKLHQQATVDMGNIKQEITGHQAEIEAQYKQELELEKQKLIKQIDLKLGDAVGSFLVEALQHNIDLGTQAEFLVSLLEEHKADFVREVAGGDIQSAK